MMNATPKFKPGDLVVIKSETFSDVRIHARMLLRVVAFYNDAGLAKLEYASGPSVVTYAYDFEIDGSEEAIEACLARSLAT